MAEYLTDDKLQQLGVKKDTAIERDSTFRSNTERRLEKEKEKFERHIAAEAMMASIEPESTIAMELDLLGVRLPTLHPSLRIWMLIFT